MIAGRALTSQSSTMLPLSKIHFLRVERIQNTCEAGAHPMILVDRDRRHGNRQCWLKPFQHLPSSCSRG